MKPQILTRFAILTVFTMAVAVMLVKFAGKPGRAPEVYGELPNFTLTNQFCQPVSLSDLKGRVWVADVIYTRCPSQCVRMTYRMAQLQAAMPRGGCVKLVSITTDPKFDTPAILRNYALRNAASDDWLFLTGETPMIGRLAIEGMKLGIADKTPGPGDDPNDIFIHSAKFVLVDKQGRVRGYYTGDTGEAQAQLLADVKRLVAEK